MLIDYVLSQQSIILRVKIRSSSTGNGKTGLSGTTSGLIIGTIADNEATSTAYTAAGSTIQTIATLGTYAAPTSGDCRFAEVDPTNHPGVYEVQLANARYAVSNAKSLMVSIPGVSGALDCDVVIPLRSVNPYDAVRGGLTALPNTACTTNASLITSGTGTDQISVSAGKTLLQATQAGVTIPAVTAVTNGVLLSVGTGAGQVNVASGKVPATLASTDVTGNIASDLQTIKTQTVACSAGVTVSPNVGTSQAMTFVSVGGVQMPKVDVEGVAGQPASTYTGQAQAGSANSITLASGETTNPLGRVIDLVGGTGAGQSAYCSAYNTGTKVATIVCPQGSGGNWATNPDSTTLYAINDVMPAIDGSSRVLLQPTQTGVTIPTVTTVTNQLTAAQIATGILTDTTSSDFTVPGSPGKVLVGQLGGAFTTSTSSVFTTASLANAPTGGGGDPWATALPGSYTIGQAGFIVGTNLNAAVAGVAAASAAAILVTPSQPIRTNSSGNVGADLQTIQTRAVTCSAAVTVNPNVGTTQPTNFTGTGASALVQADTRAVFGTAVALLSQGGTTNTLTLNAGDSAVSIYGNQYVAITSGTGAGQQRLIQSQSGLVITLYRGWDVIPDGTSYYAIGGLGEIAGPYKVGVAAGFEVALLDTTGAAYAQAAGTITVTREINGTGTGAGAGTLTQVGSTNRYYYAGTAADFATGQQGTVAFTFTGSGGGQTVEAQTWAFATTP